MAVIKCEDQRECGCTACFKKDKYAPVSDLREMKEKKQEKEYLSIMKQVTEYAKKFKW